MKILLLIPLFVLSSIGTVDSQTDSKVRRKAYYIWIKPIEPGRVNQGYLYKVQDSTLMILKSYNLREQAENKLNLTKINYHDIDKIELRKKNNKGLGILIGGISGIVLGGLIGSLVTNSHPHSHDPHSLFSNAMATASLTAVVVVAGFLTGSAIGGRTKTIQIEKERDLFEINKSILNENSLKFNPDLKGIKIQSFTKLNDIAMDADSNVYQTLALGGQVWLSKDLDVKHHADGSVIQGVMPEELFTGSRYTWFAIKDSHNICPRGWHIPSQGEWNSLSNSLGGQYAAAEKLTNDFSSRPGNNPVQWWSSTEQNATHAQSLYIDTRTVGLMFMMIDKNTPLPVRCIRD